MRTLPIILLTLGIVLLASCRTAAPEPTRVQTGLTQSEVLAAAQADVAVLASDSLAGRGYIYDGHLKAAAYLEHRFREMGLTPVNGRYVQSFPLEADLYPEAPSLTVNGVDLTPGIDFLPGPASASGSLDEVGNVVYVSSGLYLPERGIDAYAGKTVAGAVVVMEGAVPDSIRTNTSINPASYSKDLRVLFASQLGARAVIFLEDPRLIFGGRGFNASIPVLEVLKASWPENIETVSLAVETIQDERITARNVMGMVRGTAVPDSLILISAHYDHLGSLGSEIYFPGANDNASGTAMLLSLASYIAQRPLRYSVVFVGFSGEELGLIGSEYFAENPPVNLSRIRLMLNLDMVASGEQGIMAVGGRDHPDLYAMLQEANAAVGATLGARTNAPNSDHYWLTQKGVRAIFLYTNMGRQPYHHVNDRPETLEWDDYFQVYELSRRFLERVDG
jgi:aminopeptidase YwaD